MRGEFIDVGGVRLYYYAYGTRGAGEPIVLLHGLPTSGHVWGELVPLLPKGHRVLVVDLLGFGRSDRPMSGANQPSPTSELTLRAHATRLVALMDALGIRAACLVGHHLGGGVAQAAAVGWPDRITRLALVDSTAFDVQVTGTLALTRAFLPFARFVPPRLLLRAVRTDLAHRYVNPERGRHSIDHYLRPFASAGGHRVLLSHLAALTESEGEATSGSLRQLSIPTAIIWGEDDAYAPAALARRLRDLIPHASLDIIEDVRHFTPEEAPERVADVLQDLFRR